MRKAKYQFEAYWDRLYGYAFSLTRNQDDAMDLVQDCAARALSARRIPKDEPSYRAWLFRILRNLVIDRARRLQRETNGLTAVDDPEARIDPERHGDESLISSLTVRLSMDKLAPAQREILALIDIVGLSYAEAAKFLGIPVGTVMSRVSRARAALINEISAGNVRTLPLKETKRSL